MTLPKDKKAIALGVGVATGAVVIYFGARFLKRQAIGNLQWTDPLSFAVKLARATGRSYQQEDMFGPFDPQGWWTDDNMVIEIVNEIPEAAMRDVQREYAFKYGKSLPEDLVKGMKGSNWNKISYRFVGQPAKQLKSIPGGGRYGPGKVSSWSK